MCRGGGGVKLYSLASTSGNFKCIMPQCPFDENEKCIKMRKKLRLRSHKFSTFFASLSYIIDVAFNIC